MKTIKDWMQWFKNGEIFPYFQPIVSVQNKSVFGYEVLGRLKTTKGEIYTLGDFFQAKVHLKNREESTQFISYQQYIDNQILRNALVQFKNHTEANCKLFINLSPMKLWNYHKEVGHNNDLPPILKEVIEYSIDPEKIVIEITEEYIQNNLELLKPLIEIYKGFGFTFAIDDLGSRASNFDRIAIFRPEIIKVDMAILKKSLSDRNYKEILYSLSQLGENLGISLLFEGVETTEELNQAMNHGSRFLQGFLFDQALSYFSDNDKYTEKMNKFIKSFYLKRNSSIIRKIQDELEIENIIKKVIGKIQFDGTEILSCEEIFSIDSNFFRLYVTDLHGDQLSPNYIRKDGNEILIDYNTTNNNWSWRPFFSHYLYNSKKNSKPWVISNPYKDINEDFIVKTISLNIDANLIFFIDLLYGTND